jgi:hypothetical protein
MINYNPNCTILFIQKIMDKIGIQPMVNYVTKSDHFIVIKFLSTFSQPAGIVTMGMISAGTMAPP